MSPAEETSHARRRRVTRGGRQSRSSSREETMQGRVLTLTCDTATQFKTWMAAMDCVGEFEALGVCCVQCQLVSGAGGEF
jgi:hypothetical protein